VSLAAPWQLRAPSGLTVASLTVIGATAPGIEQAFDIDSGSLAIAFACQTVGALLGSSLVGIARHPLLRGRPAALATAGFIALAGAAPSFPVLAAAMFSAGVTCFVVATRAQADVSRLADGDRAQELSAFHVWGGSGGFGFPLIVAGALGLGLPWRAGFWILAVLFVGYAIVATPSLEASHPRPAAGRPRLSPQARLAIVCASTAVAIQVTIPLYLATLLVNDFGASDAAGSAAVSLYCLGVLVSRAGGTLLLRRIGLDRELRVLVAILLAGYPVLLLASSAPLVVAAAIIIGLGIGQIFPLAMSRAAELIDDDRYASSLVFSLNSAAQVALPAVVALCLLFSELQEALVGTVVFAALVALSAALSEPANRRAQPATAGSTHGRARAWRRRRSRP
jgi:MFS family permease